MGEEIKLTKEELEYEKLLREKATESFYKNWGIDRKTGLKTKGGVEYPTLKKMPKSSPKDDLRMDIKKGVEDVMKDTSEAGLAKSIEIDNLKLEFPGITDEMIENILTDMNPQRIAEVKQTMREALEMGEKEWEQMKLLIPLKNLLKERNKPKVVARR